MLLQPLRLDIDSLGNGSPEWPLDEALVKHHCRTGAGEGDIDDEDALLKGLLAAIGWAENTTRCTIVRRSHRWILREFPSDGRQEIRLPRGKTTAVQSIVYSSGGIETTLTGSSSTPAGTDYQEDLRGDSGGSLMPLRGRSWPSVDDDVPSPVVITFTAGWLADEIPGELLNAILIGACDGYDLRNSLDVSAASLQDAGKRLAARNSLISGWDMSRVY